MREGCEGHEVALPFDAFEKSGKRIAETKCNPKQPDPEALAKGTRPYKHKKT